MINSEIRDLISKGLQKCSHCSATVESVYKIQEDKTVKFTSSDNFNRE